MKRSENTEQQRMAELSEAGQNHEVRRSQAWLQSLKPGTCGPSNGTFIAQLFW